MYTFVVEVHMSRGDDSRTYRLEITCTTASEMNETIDAYVDKKFRQGWQCTGVELTRTISNN